MEPRRKRDWFKRPRTVINKLRSNTSGQSHSNHTTTTHNEHATSTRPSGLDTSNFAGPSEHAKEKQIIVDDETNYVVQGESDLGNSDNVLDQMHAQPPFESLAATVHNPTAGPAVPADHPPSDPLPHPARQNTKVPRNKEYEKLKDEVVHTMDQTKIGLRGAENFLPDGRISTIITQDRIVKTFFCDEHTLICDELHPLVSFIVDKAPKTFLITVLAVEDAERAHDAMEVFFRHGFTDECLPVANLTIEGNSSDECYHNWGDDYICSSCAPEGSKCTGNLGCKHSRPLDAFHHNCWNRSSFRNFETKQWQFNLMTFNTEVFEYPKLEENRILPLVQVSDRKAVEKFGNFSEVQESAMLEPYLQLEGDFMEKMKENASVVQSGTLVGERTHSVAIKTLKSLGEEGYDIEMEWRNESKAHKALNKLGNANIIRGLAAFKQGPNYCLLLEWANGGSLKDFWMSNPEPQISRPHMRELLNQLHGLANALYEMHDTRRSRNPSPGSSAGSRSRNSSLRRSGSAASRTSYNSNFDRKEGVDAQRGRTLSVDRVDLPSVVISGPDEFGNNTPAIFIENEVGRVVRHKEKNRSSENWRHGDIKPENILRFTNKEDRTP